MNTEYHYQQLDKDQKVHERSSLVTCLRSKYTNWILIILLALVTVGMFLPSTHLRDSDVAHTRKNEAYRANDGIQSFIVTLNDGAEEKDIDKAITRIASQLPDFRLTQRFSTVLKGFAFTVPYSLGARAMTVAKEDRLIESIEEDQPMYALNDDKLK
ncbi:hypothetical protein MP638_007446 [Amoeboaphelidium occidentale]|nr:hypothetical protein MP638_007446 [Amoeboaphelidium occidentale]